MALLLPDPRPRVAFEQTHRHLAERGPLAVFRLGTVDLDTAQVLRAEVAVLAGADQSDRCSVVTVQGAAAEVLGYEHVGCQGVRDRYDGAVAVEACERDMSDRRAGREVTVR